MRILFITPSYKPAYIYGGAMAVVYMLAESLVEQGHQVTVYTTTANGQQELAVRANTELVVDGVSVFYFKRYTKDHSHIAPALWKKLFQHGKDFEIVHLHSWWNPAIVFAAMICCLQGIKPILSPHGMFCDYVVSTRNKVKKRILHNVAGRFLLRNTFLHVSTPMEWRESQAVLNGSWPGVVIPNLVELHHRQSTTSKSKQAEFTIGFISRIDPKKGLDILIEALSRVSFEYKLLIAGSGEDEYVDSLKELSLVSGNVHKISWLGWKNNEQKAGFYSEIDLFALTSHNENFAVVVIESLSLGTPVFLSENVGLADYVRDKQLGWVTAIHTIEEVTTRLQQAYYESDKRMLIQQTAPAIVAQDFDKSFLTQQYINYYQSLVV